MTANLRAVRYRPGTFPHLPYERAVNPSRATQDEPSRASASCNTAPVLCAFALHRGRYCTLPDRHTGPHQDTRRRMIAVTVALSEPWDATPELDWAATVASVLRLTYANTTVEVIDAWSPSDLASFGLEQSGRVDQ